MSDQPSDPSSPPPPPSQPAPYAPPPGTYQPPPGPPGYQPPGATPAPVLPMRAAGRAGLISQLTGNAGWGILLGIITIAVPFIFGHVFFFLPVAGLIIGFYAIVRGKQLIGGIIAIVLNVIGGIITIIALLPTSGG